MSICSCCVRRVYCSWKNHYITECDNFIHDLIFKNTEENKMNDSSTNIVCDDCIHACVCKWKSDYAEFSARLNEDFILCCKNYKDKDEK